MCCMGLRVLSKELATLEGTCVYVPGLAPKYRIRGWVLVCGEGGMAGGLFWGRGGCISIKLGSVVGGLVGGCGYRCRCRYLWYISPFSRYEYILYPCPLSVLQSCSFLFKLRFSVR